MDFRSVGEGNNEKGENIQRKMTGCKKQMIG